ncbi:MAG TPA: hypothetical protein VMW24_11220, partial [Sedimentisphaerales bacterium]|nr:hypothetical protein [Sedimentisphaerales bacterium]
MVSDVYDVNDTILAVSSPTCDQRVIIRTAGPRVLETCGQICSVGFDPPLRSRTLLPTSIAVDEELQIDAQLYIFRVPGSYTGDDVIEIHTYANPAVIEALMGNLLKRGLRAARPGEFTARAYLNGKLDLAQAEAVNEIIVSSNEYQLAAAEKLLDGRLGETTATLREGMIELLSLIEAGL